MPRPRPTEIKLVAKMLEEEAEDADELAARIIEALDGQRQERDWYVSVARLPLGSGDPVYLASGPFTTPVQAQKDLSRLTAPGPEEGVGRVVKLRSTLATM